MTGFDIAFPLLLVLSVLRQMGGRHLTLLQLTWPLGLVVWATATYVRGFPADAPDVALVAGCAITGLALGALAGHYTDISRRADGAVIARATLATVVLWTAGTIGRLVFGLYAEHGGGATVVAFSRAHGLDIKAWTAALTLMALAEVLGRTAILAPRALHAARNPGAPAAPQVSVR
jgi:hypothetical protein